MNGTVRAPFARFNRLVGVSSCFGTFGELLQGADPDGTDFLVTMPIACWTTVRFTLEPDVPGIRVYPAHKYKAVRLARAMLSEAGYAGGGRIVVHSGIPEGKGLASSTADLVATARAIANTLGTPVGPRAVERLLRGIEPSDGVMYDAVTAFDHRRVALRGVLGSLPALTIVALDEGGAVDTVRFNQLAKPYTASQRREYAGLLDALAAAVAEHDLRTVGRIATRSAELNQHLHTKRTFTRLRAAAEELDLLGVLTAHSGTVAGLLIADSDPDYRSKRDAAERACLVLAGNATVYHSLGFQC
ncbi:kinase [Allonocardiopsis opalescens]|uniref:Threonine kinase n=1 Tax=Allonocardiopsis opalescens TaxID=1144618 RepID=A0A2T0PYD0_9ACTN|nr:kinase [Allonocardiopsis opalescens]PRX96522.1 threonine kinase [Allonocardiopsis opalescens]